MREPKDLLCRTWQNLCPLEYQAILEQPFFRRYISAGSMPDSDIEVYYLESFLESILISVDNDFALPKSALTKRLHICSVWRYLDVFSRSRKDCESVASPLALSYLVKVGHCEETLDLLSVIKNRLVLRRKIDPISIFALAEGLIGHTQMCFLDASQLHSRDLDFYNSRSVHPLVPLTPGTSTHTGISRLYEQVSRSVIFKSDSERQTCLNILIYYLEQ